MIDGLAYDDDLDVSPEVLCSLSRRRLRTAALSQPDDGFDLAWD